MLPVFEFNDIESLAVYLGRNEISQQNNTNANSRLFIVGNHRGVAKIFDGFRSEKVSRNGISFLPGAEKNIENAIRISEIISVDQFPMLALPTALLSFAGQIVGYEMPYILGIDLGVALTDSKYSHRQKLNWFNQLVDIILSLPDGVFIGDLHPQNAIVREDGTVVLVDVDGFSLCSGHLMTCPAMFIEELPPKYFDSYGSFRISRETDILCLFRIFFRYIFEGLDIATFSLEWKKQLADYLDKRGLESSFVSAVSCLFSQERNILRKDIFSCWAELPPTGEYQQFLKLTGLDLVESMSEKFINAMIGEVSSKHM